MIEKISAFLVGCLIGILFILFPKGSFAQPSAEASLLSLEKTIRDCRASTSNILIEVNESGLVQETLTQYVNEKNAVSFVTVADLKKSAATIAACADQLSKADFTETTPTCADDPGVHYKSKFGAKEFAVRRCGQLQKVEVPCAEDMVDLLDALEQVSRYQ